MSAAPAWLSRLLAADAPLRGVDSGLLSVLDEADAGAPYDARAFGYDLVIGSKLYSRFVWDSSPDDYAAFISAALASRSGGVALDIAAGSCLASARCYAEEPRDTVVLDRSLGMLRRGRRRTQKLCTGDSSHLAWLQADGLALPFRDGCFETVLCHGALHLFADPVAACREWRRVLAPGGSVYVSSLVLARPRGDRLLATLHRAGEIAAPRSPGQVAAALQEGFGAAPRIEQRGNFAFARIDPASD